MERLISTVLAALTMAVLVSPAAAQVGLMMHVTGGPAHMEIVSAPAGFEPAPVIADHAKLEFTLGAVVATALKITVETTAPGQRFGLAVRADAPTAGSSTGLVDLTNGMLPVDLVRDVLPAHLHFETDLVYRATATLSQGTGLDEHVVVYSITEQ